MRNTIYILTFAILLFVGCKKDKSISHLPSLPYENDQIKFELVTSSAPFGIRDILFVNESTGIAVTYEGKIYKSINSGIDWNLQYSSPIADFPLLEILFINENVGFVVGGSTSCNGSGCIPPGGLVLKTTDGGNTWATVFQLPSDEIVSIATNSLGDLFVISNGKKGRIHKSINLGTDWNTTDSVKGIILQKITFNHNIGFLTGVGGKLYKSDSNGSTWVLMNTLSADYINIKQFDSTNAFCITNNNQVYKTNNNGSNWQPILIHQNGALDLKALSLNNILVFGKGNFYGGHYGTWSGEIIQTINGGESWTNLEFREIEPIRYSSFYSSTEGYLSANKKLIKVTVK